MVNCAVYMCKRRSTTSNLRINNISYHRFPKDPTLRQVWRKFCNRSNKWHPSHTSAICSEHFTPSSFNVYSNKRILNEDAKPTLRTCYCSKKKQEKLTKNEDSSKGQPQTSKKETSKNVATSTTKKSKSDMHYKNKIIKRLRDNMRYLKKKVNTLKENIDNLQGKSLVVKEENTFEENKILEAKILQRYCQSLSYVKSILSDEEHIK